ncbi:non-homologous end joining protein Ku [Sphingomicrobium aestuariivivum]|uniref:non-homologous end joining protein Ku n=1 Tax=Sphingomicrobium aestuariivivum TaxID=1582356 RepID=UPI001FD70100|nr:Ku protein [Sphingomicrobium aestuariivivum]MCJ8190749.1 Ku protein [Sphingomicrobium aestuariivivum]
MPARASWKGQIRLALVAIPVEIYPATKSGSTVSFHQVHEPSGQRVRYEKVVPGIGPVDRDEIVKGYEVDKGEYVLLEPEEVEAVKLESKRTLELIQFVEQGEIDAIYFEKPYFVVPQDELAEDAFIVLRDALRQAGKVGIGQLAMRGREYVVSVKPCGRGLILETLRYEEELRKAESYFREIGDDKPDKELLELATSLIDKKTAPFDAGKFEDRYVEALRDLIDKKVKAKGKRVIGDATLEEERPSGSNVVDLMAALKASLDEGKGKKKAAPKKTTQKKAAPKKKAS